MLESFKYAVNLAFRMKARSLSPAVSTSSPDKSTFEVIKSKPSNLVFLIGFPRSGTTLLDTILRTHSKTLVLEEKTYLENTRNYYFTSKNKIKNYYISQYDKLDDIVTDIQKLIIEKSLENENIELEEFLENSKEYGVEKGHKIAFIEKTDSKYNDQDLDVPFVCIKIPTGGGKTLVGCHMLNSIYDRFSRGKNQKGLVLWLVPTDAIRTQTLHALRNREHPYRETLDQNFSNNIKIMDFKEALSIKKSDIEDKKYLLFFFLIYHY